MITLEASYEWCRQVARTRAANFYYSFLLLDKPRRDAMCAIYAFMRICDDLSDEPGEHTDAAFDDWRDEMSRALRGEPASHNVWPAFADTARRYRIPEQYFHDMIDGVHSDIHFQPMETYAQLYQYCYRVASVVGLTVIHILGFRSQEALPLAEKCGVAFQLTNILRDVREDYENGRIYLPAEDLRRYDVGRTAFDGSEVSGGLWSLLAFEAARARELYRESRPLVQLVERSGRPMLAALIETYSTLLDRIETSGYDVLRRRIALSKPHKLWILAKHALWK
ncbi:MAG: phytoene/squalene synthase family protein [Bryobacterales bacterium]|nr:phytoene/squalene synthase family protein [Bryobacterales bacterium]